MVAVSGVYAIPLAVVTRLSRRLFFGLRPGCFTCLGMVCFLLFGLPPVTPSLVCFLRRDFANLSALFCMRRMLPSVSAVTCSDLLTSIPINPPGCADVTGRGSNAMDMVVSDTVTAPIRIAVASFSTMWGVSCISMVCLNGITGKRNITYGDASSGWFGASDSLHQKLRPYMTHEPAPCRSTGLVHKGRRVLGVIRASLAICPDRSLTCIAHVCGELCLVFVVAVLEPPVYLTMSCIVSFQVVPRIVFPYLRKVTYELPPYTIPQAGLVSCILQRRHQCMVRLVFWRPTHTRQLAELCGAIYLAVRHRYSHGLSVSTPHIVPYYKVQFNVWIADVGWAPSLFWCIYQWDTPNE